MSKCVSGLEPLYPFSSIDPLVRSDQEYLSPPLIDDTDILQSFTTRQIIGSNDEGLDTNDPVDQQEDRSIFDILSGDSE